MPVLVVQLFLISLSLIALSALPDQLTGRQESLTYQLLDRLRAWRASVGLEGTTFCERCSQVSTAVCHRGAQMERARLTTRRLELPRF